jgi:hypothetical protein
MTKWNLPEGRKPLNAPAPAGVTIKPLVWEDFDERGAKASAFYNANYLIQLWKGRGQFEVSMSYPGHQTGYDGERWHDTLEAAKAAAQADYEARIMAALEPSPAGMTVPDELYQAAKRDAEEAEAYAAELEKERDDLQLKLAGAVAECERIGGLWHTAEAKLAKAVDVLDWAVICWDDHNKHGYEMQGDWVPDARAALKELKGEKDE